MLMLTCSAVLAGLPACKVLLIISSIAFASALALYVLGVVALRRRFLARRRGDPYAQPFGDVPRKPLRSFNGPHA